MLTYFISGTVIHHGPIIKLHLFNLPKGTVVLESAQLQLAGFRGIFAGWAENLNDHSQINR